MSLPNTTNEKLRTDAQKLLARNKHIKTGVLMFLLFLESLLLTKTLLRLVITQNYFTPSTTILLAIIAGLLSIAYTVALTIGVWHKWEQYLVIIVPICLGMFMVVVPFGFVYASLICIVVAIQLSIELHIASTLKAQLISFNPRFVLRHLTKSITVVFAIAAASIVLINPNQIEAKTITQKLSDITYDSIVNVATNNASSYGLAGVDVTQVITQDVITEKINDTVLSYEQFVPSVIALIAYGLIKFLGIFMYIAYSITISAVFWIAEKSEFLQIQTEQVTREKHTF